MNWDRYTPNHSHLIHGAALTDKEILLVEDSATDVELTLAALGDLADRVFVASDGAEALDYSFATETHALKVIFLDLHLPQVSGLEVLQRLKSHDRTKAIPVVVLTSSEDERQIAEAYERGANSYIVEPVKFKDFTKAIRELGHYWTSLNVKARRTGADIKEAKRNGSATDGIE